MFKNKKIPYLRFLPILIISFITFKIINNIEFIVEAGSAILSILSPFIWAFMIAYLLNPLMVYIENRLKIGRYKSLLLTYVIVIGCITIFITILLPTITKSTGELFKNMPNYITQTELWLNKWLDHSKLLNVVNLISEGKEGIFSLLDNVMNFLNTSLNGVLAKTIKFTSSFLKGVFGLIISVYILKDKEIFIKDTKNFLKAFLPENRYMVFTKFLREVDNVFSKYIIGKSIDSFIIGLICLVGLKILRVPYAELIALIVGITNMIPYFGPFIGMIPAFIITLFYSFKVAFWVLIFIIILQQFDGWYLGPKILGSKVGLNPFWIILAITIGQGTFGVMGMFLSVPVMAIIKNYLDQYIKNRVIKLK